MIASVLLNKTGTSPEGSWHSTAHIHVRKLCPVLILPPKMQETEWSHPCCLLRTVPCLCSSLSWAQTRAGLDEKHTKD